MGEGEGQIACRAPAHSAGLARAAVRRLAPERRHAPCTVQGRAPPARPHGATTLGAPLALPRLGPAAPAAPGVRPGANNRFLDAPAKAYDASQVRGLEAAPAGGACMCGRPCGHVTATLQTVCAHRGNARRCRVWAVACTARHSSAPRACQSCRRSACSASLQWQRVRTMPALLAPWCRAWRLWWRGLRPTSGSRRTWQGRGPGRMARTRARHPGSTSRCRRRARRKHRVGMMAGGRRGSMARRQALGRRPGSLRGAGCSRTMRPPPLTRHRAGTRRPCPGSRLRSSTSRLGPQSSRRTR